MFLHDMCCAHPKFSPHVSAVSETSECCGDRSRIGRSEKASLGTNELARGALLRANYGHSIACRLKQRNGLDLHRRWQTEDVAVNERRGLFCACQETRHHYSHSLACCKVT